METEKNVPPPPLPPVMTQPGFNGQIGPQTTIVMPMPLDLGGETRRMNCPHCGADVSTEVKFRNGRITHLAALLLCFFGCICCCCIPYCVDSCKDAEHTCPNCERHIGYHRR